jgi:chemotaxis protein methyltransferase CheR
MRHSPANGEHYPEIPYQKYFVINRRKNLIKLKPPLLNKPTFLKHDIVTQGNIFDRKFDLIFCRNVLIYFNHELQNRLFQFFYDNLEDDGCLIIGRHEGMLGEIATKFKKEESIYKKRVL